MLKGIIVIKVLLPSYRSTELLYTLDIVLNEFLGLDYEVEHFDGEDVELFMSTHQQRIKLDTSFFKLANEHWLKPESMPALPLDSWTPGKDGIAVELTDDELPILFGSKGIEKENQCIRINLDILGTVFFMVSRYEELVTKDRDSRDRFPAKASIAAKSDFLQRPIVDEYVEILWFLIHSAWPQLVRKENKSEVFVSCDVDQPFDHTVLSLKSTLKTAVADLIKRKSPIKMVQRLNRYLFNKLGVYKFDTNYTFDWYMDVCEGANLKAAFYFIPTSVEVNNGCYEVGDKNILALMQKIDSRGHEIGLHGSYQTFRDADKLLKQKKLLEQAIATAGIDQTVKGNRQHYLRWDSAVTPEHLDNAGILYDTSGSYADCAGFRYGTAKEFSMWGWQREAKLKLKQRPLIVMECSVIAESYMGMGTGDAAFDFIIEAKKKSHHMGGNFSLLWHNSYFDSREHKALFQKILNH